MSSKVVAFVAPLGTEEAVVAAPMLAAARAAAAAAGRQHGVSVGVVAFDDGRDPVRAASIVGRLGCDPCVVGVIGPKNSGSARAAAPRARAAGLPMVLPAATADDLCALGDGSVFRLCARDRDTAAACAELCVRLGVGRLAVRADETDYGRGLARAVRAAARAARVEVTSAIHDADALFHAMGEVEQAAAIRAAREGGFTGVLLGAEGGPGAPLAGMAGPAGEGAWQLYPGAAVPDAADVYGPESADAATALVAALALAGDRAGMSEALRAASFRGRSGTVAFTPGGERSGAAVSVWRLLDGRCVPAEAESRLPA
ncbi:hypothetical protein BH23ACT7_BH23ACT7_27650 [soil metagenome]|jgi:branched-chain amino acid transport system substrate-binding protein